MAMATGAGKSPIQSVIKGDSLQRVLALGGLIILLAFFSIISEPFRTPDNYVSILKILLDQRQVARAAQVMRDIAREDVQTFSWLGYSLAEVIEQYRFGAEARDRGGREKGKNPETSFRIRDDGGGSGTGPCRQI